MWIVTLSIISVVRNSASLSEQDKKLYPCGNQYCRWLPILHQGDIHSHFDQVTSFNNVCPRNASATNTTCYGGFARAVAYGKWSFRKNNAGRQKRPLVLNTGDFFQGHIYYTYFGWKVVADMVSQMPYTALALGTQEFADGLDNLLSFMRQVGPKFLCTNYDFSHLNESMRAEFTKLCPRHRVVGVREEAGYNRYISVGLLGYTTPKTKLLLQPSENVIFEDEVMALNREIALIHNNTVYNKRKDGLRTRGVKVFIALGHSGLERDREIALQVPELDVIVGGHSHTLTWMGVWQPFLPMPPEDPTDIAQDIYPIIVTQASGRKVVIVHPGKHGKYMGVIDVGVNNSGEVRDWWPNIFLIKSEHKADAEVEKILDEYDRRLDGNRTEVIGHTRVHLPGSPDDCFAQECALGNMVAEAILWVLRRQTSSQAGLIQLALINAGAFTNGDIPTGDITLGRILEAMPSQDTLTVVRMSGQTLRETLDHSITLAHSGGFLHLAGARVVSDWMASPGERVVSLTIRCADCKGEVFEPVNLTAEYNVVVPGHVADGSDGYRMVLDHAEPNDVVYMLDVDVIIRFFRAFEWVNPGLDGRILVRNLDGYSRAGVRRLDMWLMTMAVVLCAAVMSGDEWRLLLL